MQDELDDENSYDPTMTMSSQIVTFDRRNVKQSYHNSPNKQSPSRRLKKDIGIDPYAAGKRVTCDGVD